jgi:hypothetical protein
MKKTIHIRDTGHSLDGRPRKLVKTCKTKNSKNRLSECERKADHLQTVGMFKVAHAARRAEWEDMKAARATAQREARRAKREARRAK